MDEDSISFNDWLRYFTWNMQYSHYTEDCWDIKLVTKYYETNKTPEEAAGLYYEAKICRR